MDKFSPLAFNLGQIAAFSVFIWVLGHYAVWVYYDEAEVSRRHAPKVYTAVRFVTFFLFVTILIASLLQK